MSAIEFPVIPVLNSKYAQMKLRLAEDRDCDAIVDYYVRNRAHFAPTDPVHPEGFFTPVFWIPRIALSREEFMNDVSVRLFLFDQDDTRVLGSTNYTQIARGPLQACYLGYGIDQSEEGKGIMTQALRAGIDYMFDVKNLHRIMANHLPENERSARVLKRLGFEVDGMAKQYLLINGAWRDHVLNSLVNPNWRAS